METTLNPFYNNTPTTRLLLLSLCCNNVVSVFPFFSYPLLEKRKGLENGGDSGSKLFICSFYIFIARLGRGKTNN